MTLVESISSNVSSILNEIKQGVLKRVTLKFMHRLQLYQNEVARLESKISEIKIILSKEQSLNLDLIQEKKRADNYFTRQNAELKLEFLKSVINYYEISNQAQSYISNETSAISNPFLNILKTKLFEYMMENEVEEYLPIDEPYNFENHDISEESYEYKESEDSVNLDQLIVSGIIKKGYKYHGMVLIKPLVKLKTAEPSDINKNLV